MIIILCNKKYKKKKGQKADGSSCCVILYMVSIQLQWILNNKYKIREFQQELIDGHLVTFKNKQKQFHVQA